MSNEIEFADGLIVKPPHEKAPDYVKGQISIKIADFGMWLREKHKAGDEWVNLDIKVAKSGKWYASVNTYKKGEKVEPKQERKAEPATGGAFDGVDSDIPF